ncbi:PGF-CTERM sorting domain-containing protein [Halorarius litoreus]|uniref:PGF-CTERM sorting domain-containing protein n=1 Tax=Halorarius litoreus TaxID=2962676 RepID=UPI0020CE6F4D|nr:PGF-CTERM sorting domain-containing protein [Halorarius litoreus]
MPESLSRRTVTVLVLTVALLLAAVGPSVALVATQQDYEVADGRQGRVDPGREDDESQEFPINITFYPIDHAPGVTNGAFEVYASGLTEDMTVHWVVLETRAFDVGTCKASDASAFGIDRGNDEAGTKTNQGLLTAYKTYESKPSGFFIGFYKESALAGEPVVATTSDQVVARQNNCVNNPEEPGWYRVNGYINGSTKNDTTTDYTIYATSQYTYVCDCSSREEAREKLGPPPNEQSGSESSTPEATATATATTTSTPDQQTTTATTTPTPDQQTTTATAGPKQDGVSPTPRPQTATTPTPTQSVDDGNSTPTAQTTATENRAVATTPTLAEGPGFGPLLAVLALIGAALLLGRRP